MRGETRSLTSAVEDWAERFSSSAARRRNRAHVCAVHRPVDGPAFGHSTADNQAAALRARQPTPSFVVEHVFPNTRVVIVSDEPSNPSVLVWISGLAAAVLVAIVSSFLSAGFSRAEALRQERRSAYADFLGIVQTCNSTSLVDAIDFEMRRLDPAFDPLKADAPGNLIERLTKMQDCFERMTTGAARISILTYDQDVEDATHKLIMATIAVTSQIQEDEAQRKREQIAYIRALSDFQLAAKSDANRFVSSLVSPTAAGMAAIVLLSAVTFSLVVFRQRGVADAPLHAAPSRTGDD